MLLPNVHMYITIIINVVSSIQMSAYQNYFNIFYCEYTGKEIDRKNIKRRMGRIRIKGRRGKMKDKQDK